MTRKHRVSTLPLTAAAIAIASISVSSGSLGAADGPAVDGSALAGRTAGQVGSLLALDSLSGSTSHSVPPPAGPSVSGGGTTVRGGATIALSSLPVPTPTLPIPTLPIPTTTTMAPVVTGLPGPAVAPATGDVWARLRQCESGGDYSTDTGNGYYGAYQFSEATWLGIGQTGYPDDAPPPVQDQAAYRLQNRSGWGQWPACSQKLGL